MFMGVAKCPGGVDGSLVGVEDCLGSLLLLFTGQAIQLVQAMVIGLVISCDWRDTVGNDLVVECI